MNIYTNSSYLFELDYEIERTLHLLKRRRNLLIQIEQLNIIDQSDQMANNAEDRTLKELAAPDVAYQPLCIQYPDLNANFELKSGLIQLLPKFHGLAGEDPHKHLKEFHVVFSTMKPQDVAEEHIKLRAFPFSLQDTAKDWLYYLHPGSVTCWNDLKKLFLGKFFPASRAVVI